jgi:hypothetical protein
LIKNSEIAKYQEFVDVLSLNLQDFRHSPEKDWKNTADKYVDGLAADELRRLVALDARKKDGIFFTNSYLAKTVFKQLKPTFNKNSVLYDPACGAGNLIIAAQNFLFEKKIELSANEHFLGTDIHDEFIEAAKLRCSINQLLLSTKSQTKITDESIFNFTKANGLEPNEKYAKATDIIVNPPFNLVEPNEKLDWSAGKVSAAALFIYKIVQNINAGVSIYAILPDVLRSGSRYEKWRQLILQKCIVGKTKLLGQFDKHADVDVFAIHLTKRQNAVSKITKKSSKNAQPLQKVSDLFDVCVGPVVDNRDSRKGENRRYVVSKGLKGWTIQTEVPLTRMHEGKCFTGPFVVVKRTSRMGDSQRAIATIININQPVFVDNHLIVLKPKSGTLRDCRYLLSVLKNNRTDEWLNNKIRCRHLTVKIVSEIPIWQ